MGPAQHGPDLVPTWAQPALNIIGPDSFHTGKHCALCLPQFNIALPGFARRISAQSSHTIHHKSLLGRRPAVRRKPLNNNNKIDIDIHWYTLSEAEADTKQCLDLPITVGIKLCEAVSERLLLADHEKAGGWNNLIPIGESTNDHWIIIPMMNWKKKICELTNHHWIPCLMMIKTC